MPKVVVITNPNNPTGTHVPEPLLNVCVVRVTGSRILFCLLGVVYLDAMVVEDKNPTGACVPEPLLNVCQMVTTFQHVCTVHGTLPSASGGGRHKPEQAYRHTLP